MAVYLRHGAASCSDEGRASEAWGNVAAPPSVVRTALRRGSTRRGHLLGEVTPSLVRHRGIDNVAVDHSLVEQLVCNLAEGERPRQPHRRSVELAVHIAERTVAGENEFMGGARGDRPEA